MAIAPARAEDAREIHDLFDLVAGEGIHLLRMESPGLVAIQNAIEESLGDGGVYMVQREEERLVGCLVVSRMRWVGCHHVGNLAMMVHPDFRGMGHGTRLLEVGLDACGKKGIWRIELSVYPQNIPAVKMYRSAGFDEEGITTRGRLLDEESWDFLELALLHESRPPRCGDPPLSAMPRPARTGRERRIEIEPAQPHHAAGIHRVMGRVARERRWLLMVKGFDLASTRAYIATNTTEGNPYLVARDGETVVGTIDVIPYRLEGQQHIGNLGMLLDSEYRGIGIGSRLMESVIAWSRKAGLKQIHLGVWDSNAPARSMYRNHGFIETRRRQRMRRIDGYEDDLIEMQLMLDG